MIVSAVARSCVDGQSDRSRTGTVALNPRGRSARSRARLEVVRSPCRATAARSGFAGVPLPAGSHHAGRPLVPAVRAVLPRRRGAARRTRHRGGPRDREPVGPAVHPAVLEAARPCRRAPGDRWFVDETYVKVSGRWRYLYRAVDQFGQVIDVLLTTKRDKTAARRSSPGRWLAPPNRRR